MIVLHLITGTWKHQTEMHAPFENTLSMISCASSEVEWKPQRPCCYKAEALRRVHGSDLHDSDSAVGDSSPVDGAHHDTSSCKGSRLRDEPVSQVQHVDHGT